MSTTRKLSGAKIRLFDNSELTGQLIELDKDQNLLWRHNSVSTPISFNYKSVSNILFDRSLPPNNQIQRSLKSLKLYFRNGDHLRCKYKQLTNDHLLIETGFSESIKVPLIAIQKLEFLPDSHYTLYDSSFGLENWKKSNAKSWSFKEGDFISVFSGSVGKLLPQKESLDIRFQAEWERSFYLAIRIFSDSDGSNYGNVGYHLSFSNNRLNLQVNKRKKGRIMRETLGSIMVDGMLENRKAHFRILAHRTKKEFIIFINDLQIARWKDSTEDFHPDENGILFINQGGNSYIRLKEVNISGWNGSYFPSQDSQSITSDSSSYIVLSNGDATSISSIVGDKESISISTPRGLFNIPIKRIRNVTFIKDQPKLTQTKPTEQLLLSQSLGHLSCTLNSISKDKLSGIHPNFGEFKFSLNSIKQIKCNQHLLRRMKYLEELRAVKKALDRQQPDLAASILNELPSAQHSWYWHRLSFLARCMQSDEVLNFTPHPNKGLASASFAGNSQSIISTNNNGEYALWDGHAKLASGSFSNSSKFPSELGRFLNEQQHAVTLSHPYWLSETEVTKEQFKAVTAQKLNNEKNGSLPMVCNWFDAQKFCSQLNQLQKPPNGYTWRLPTEAEWENACRSDSTGPFCNSQIAQLQNNEAKLEEHLSKYGWFEKNSKGKINPVKQKLPNSFGLYDMHGNVWEWCLDSTRKTKAMLLKQRISGIINPYSSNGDWRILRGGCYDLKFDRCRSAYRGANAPSVVNGDRGFRIALSLDLKNELNSTNKSISNEIIQLKEFGIKLLPISPKTFLMGSPNNLTSPKAITNSFGDQLITVSTEGMVGTTDFSGRPIKEILDLNSSVTSIFSSADDQWVLIGCYNGSVHLFKGGKLTHIRMLHHNNFPITSVSISPKGKRFSTSGLDGKVNSYTLPECKLEWSIIAKDHNTSFDYLEYNQQGTKLLTSGVGSIPKLFEAKTGREIHLNPFPYNEIMRSRFLKNGESFASITYSGMLIFTEASHGLVYKIVRLKLQNLIDFSFSPYGEKLIVSTRDGTCSVQKTPINNNLYIRTEKKNLVYSPDYFFALANKSEPISTQLSEFTSIQGLSNHLFLNQKGYKISSDGKLILTTLDGALRLWCLETEKWMATLGDKFVAPFVDCAFSPEGSMVAGKLKTNEFLIYPIKKPSSLNSNSKSLLSEIENWF